ncbi:MAG: proliferating cell nuclear antigen (pcna) [DPANN group archaeon]|nr:proliferating cell nuclear antigen (pcna) [DPANN group archaeon]
MKLTLTEPKYLKDSITIISELVNEARFRVTKDAIELVAMDPANVAMVIFKLLASNFTEYQVEKDADISINLSNFKQILRRLNSTDILTLELEENKLKVEMKAKTKRTFHLPLIEMEEKEQKIPDLKFPVSVTIPSSALNEAVEDADIVAESLAFIASKGLFVVEAEGDLNKARVELTADDDTKIDIEGDDIRSRYSIEYLKKMIAGSKLSDKVELKFNKDYPLKIEYKALDKVFLGFILAPRVEND